MLRALEAVDEEMHTGQPMKMGSFLQTALGEQERQKIPLRAESPREQLCLNLNSVALRWCSSKICAQDDLPSEWWGMVLVLN